MAASVLFGGEYHTVFFIHYRDHYPNEELQATYRELVKDEKVGENS